ncbi:hypothetical protein [Amycolatopsis sp. CA-126428]|uniref:hypothetical protein n=1 Tax=Amycolatopsis sp. CA-126428 TaxID=2073158 RepID=UPI0011B0BE13|nr:hypothetical protein [Amycolatopsis sp. CA-126428]
MSDRRSDLHAAGPDQLNMQLAVDLSELAHVGLVEDDLVNARSRDSIGRLMRPFSRGNRTPRDQARRLTDKLERCIGALKSEHVASVLDPLFGVSSAYRGMHYSERLRIAAYTSNPNYKHVRYFHGQKMRLLGQLASICSEQVEINDAPSPRVRSELVVGGAYEVASISIFLRWPTSSDRQKTYLETRTIRSLSSRLQYWRGSHRYDESRLPDLKIITGGRLNWRNAGQDVVFMEVEFPRYLKENEEHTFTLLHTQMVDDPYGDITYDFAITPVVPVDNFSLSIYFPERKPSSIWSFRDVTRPLIPHVPPELKRSVAPDRLGNALLSHGPGSMRLGYSYGLAWIFQAEDNEDVKNGGVNGP